MNICKHDEVEKDVALVDGYCPLCLIDDIAALTTRLKEAEAIIKPFAYVQIKLESGAGDVSVISFGEHYRRAAAFLAGGDPNKV